jgi:molybdopterin converting factor subunit 1
MHVRMLYFGQARDASGKNEEAFSVAPGTTVASLLERASGRHEKLAKLKPTLKLALNEEMADGDEQLKEGDVVAVLPPVAGG